MKTVRATLFSAAERAEFDAQTEQVVSDAGYHIQQDRPAVVADAVRQIATDRQALEPR